MKIHYPQPEQHSPYSNVSGIHTYSFNEALKILAEAEKEEQARREIERREYLEKRGEPKTPKDSFLAFMYGCDDEEYPREHFITYMKKR